MQEYFGDHDPPQHHADVDHGGGEHGAAEKLRAGHEVMDPPSGNPDDFPKGVHALQQQLPAAENIAGDAGEYQPPGAFHPPKLFGRTGAAYVPLSVGLHEPLQLALQMGDFRVQVGNLIVAAGESFLDPGDADHGL